MTLSPTDAAYLADASYAVEGLQPGATGEQVYRSVLAASKAAADWVDERWHLQDGGAPGLAHGASGIGLISKTTGFALVLKGRKGSGFDNEYAVAIRGTASVFDALSDLHASVTTSPVGLPVHTGFARIYNDMHLQIKQSVPSGARVHIAGHSLGGALGNLLAADLSRGGNNSVNLYTFGSPRVGLLPFGHAMGSRQGLEGIYRVYDVIDPVPMVPIFPFVHAPLSADGYRVGASGGIMDPNKHKMTGNYLRAVSNQTWASLRSPEEPIYNYRKLDELIEAAGIHVRIPGGSWGLWALSKILQPLMEVASLVVGGVKFIGETVIDMVAKMLMRAAEVSQRIGSAVMKFIELVMKWAGRAATTTAQLTKQFLTYLLKLLMMPIIAAARRAIERPRV